MKTHTDFNIRFANVNGTGSASANALVTKCLFRMGFPVGPKNMFPSNIQGLPTWYEIRLSEKGFTGRKGGVDLMVAMNAQTLDQDTKEVRAGGFLVYDSTKALLDEKKRSDIVYLPLPATELAREKFTNPRQRLLLQNLIYVGAVAYWIGLDLAEINLLIADQYKAKPKLIPLNQDALAVGFQFAEKASKPLPFRVERQLQKTPQENILLEGNYALALGALYAGATFCSWYPITPSTSVVDAFQRLCFKYRRTQTGEHKFAIVQAEDEIAALGMVLGASWNGCRSFTATSGPGISLMSEFLGYAYYAELPAVIFNIQRCGPSTGMPTRTQQADLLLCAYASHGDTKHLLLFPSSPRECFDFSLAAFDFAERFQTPILVLSDLEIGMNEYFSKPLSLPSNFRHDRGKILRRKDLEARGKPFYRYLDEDDDGIPYRTLPGDCKEGTYFTRGSGHDKWGRYTEDGKLYQENMDRIVKKFKRASAELPKAEVKRHPEAKLGVIYFGSTEEPLLEACENLPVSLMRLRSFPFGQEVLEFIEESSHLVVVEQNRDGQMRKLLLQELEVPASKIKSLLSYSGLPLEASFVREGLLKLLM